MRVLDGNLASRCFDAASSCAKAFARNIEIMLGTPLPEREMAKQDGCPTSVKTSFLVLGCVSLMVLSYFILQLSIDVFVVAMEATCIQLDRESAMSEQSRFHPIPYRLEAGVR